MDTFSDSQHSLDQKIKPWFKEGLKFKCTGCGKCCTGSPGYVFLSRTDLERLSSHFSLSETDFIKKYTRKVGTRLSLIDRPKTADCIFLVDNRCSVYEARPIQCRTFPWWAYQIKTEETWEEASQYCEGINHPEAELVDMNHIGKECRTYLDNVLEQNFVRGK
jgi:Fe-S-cluster containining protein